MVHNFNAIRHGLYAKHVVLPWERKADFEELLVALRAEHQPDGVSQHEVVNNLAALLWRKRRTNSITQLLYMETPYGQLIEEVGETDPDAIHKHQGKQKAENARRLRRLRKSIKQLGNACAELAKRPAVKKAPTTVTQAMLRRAEDLLHEVQKLQPAAEAALATDAKPASIAAITLDCLDKAAAAEARLDSQITKQIQQLILLKEYAKNYFIKPVTPLLEHRAEPTPMPPTIVTVEAEPSLKPDPPASTTAEAPAITMQPIPVRTVSIVNRDVTYDNDNDNDNNDDEINPRDFDWEPEYDEALAKRKAKRKRNQQL